MSNNRKIFKRETVIFKFARRKMKVCVYVVKKVFLVSVVLSVLLYLWISREPDWKRPQRNGKMIDNYTAPAPEKQKKYLVLYYNPSPFLSVNRKYAMACNFKECEWKNCELSINKNDANRSDAVIYDGIFIPKQLNFTRPMGQVWIFAAHESPHLYHMGSNWWYKNNYSFNWTMTYNRDNTDIYLPYGEIRRRRVEINRDYETIVSRKNSTPIMIASHCTTPAKRQEYVQELKKHIDINILGLCGGKKWNCGKHFRHDDFCFQILNKTYLFYLAFENALCHYYFTEKFFENFNYDTIMIMRGGLPGDVKRLFPEGSYISTDDFKSVKDLAMYLKSLTVSDYARMLRKKNQYFSTGYKPVYQRALCDICHRMNFQKKYEKTIKDMKKWAFDSKPCLDIKEVKDIR